MPYRLPHARTLLTAAAFSLLCLLAVAAIAVADGEDDPAFNGAGTAFVSIDEVSSSTTDPVVDQAADGAVLSAVGIEVGNGTAGERASRGTTGEAIRVARLDSAGHLSGLDGDGVVDVPSPEFGELLDIDGMADGRIVIVSSGFAAPTAGRASGEPGDTLVISTLAADGEMVDQALHAPPSACEGSDAWPEAAEIDADGRVFTVWNDCSGDPVAARYGDDDVVTERLSQLDTADEVALGPDGSVFVLGTAVTGGSEQQLRLSQGASMVVRLDADLDGTDYGTDSKFGGTTLPGFPIDLAVDHAGRAVVWTDAAPVVVDRGVGQQWTLYRLAPDGTPDGDWGEAGVSAISHPDLGQTSCNCPAHLIVQGDDKVVAIGPGNAQRNRRGKLGPQWVIVRTTAAGALDPSWDGDGVRAFDVEQPDSGFSYLATIGEPGLQADGKLLVPVLAQSDQLVTRVPAPPYGGWLGVSRIGLTPPAPAPAAQPQAAVPAPPAPAAKASASRAVPAPQCKSRRTFSIRLRTGRRKADRSRIVAATVKVNGKAVTVSRSARRRARVSLVNLPKGRFTVSIRLRLEDGGIVRETRRYRTCAPKVERELGPLRTRPPR